MASFVLCTSLALGACGGGGAADGSAPPPAVPPAAPAPAPQGQVSISALAPDHGPAGVLVTLTGSGFSSVPADNRVELNNKPCTVVAATATELKVIIPVQAGTGNLQVTVQANSAQSAAFTYELGFVTVSTLAGSQPGYLDADGTAAKFNGPAGLALHASGVLFVSDSVNNRIRTVSATGLVGTFVGSGIEGSQDGTGTGPATGAQFHNPVGLAFDSFGNLLVADFNNNSIRKVTPAGLVTTLVHTSAGMSGPSGLARDRFDNLYVADEGNHRILKVEPSGVVTLFAGGTSGAADGTGAAAQFQFPTGLTFCPDGNMFVADKNNHLIRKITPAGEVTTHAGGNPVFADGPRAQAGFLFPRELACDGEGKLFVVDTGNERIRMITLSGVVTLAGGTAVGSTDGDGASARFSLPQNIAIAADGSLLIADAANQRIRKIVWQ